MVAILLRQPDEPARGPGPARVARCPRAGVPQHPYPRPVDLATVEAIPLRSVPKRCPIGPRIRRRRLVALLVAVALFAAAATAGRALLSAAASVGPLLAATGRCPGLVTAGGDHVVRRRHPVVHRGGDRSRL